MTNRVSAQPSVRGNFPHRRILLLLGLLSAFALRLFRLGNESLWYDETVSVVLARKTIPALLTHTAGDIHPLGYYLLLHFWQRITTPLLNHGLEFLFAWPSLWWGILSVALIYSIGYRLFSPPVALSTLWLVALHPYQIWYSQEVRMYTLGMLLGLLCFGALLTYVGIGKQSAQYTRSTSRPTSRPQWHWLLLYTLSAATGLYTLYYFLFLIVALNCIALLTIVRPILPHQSGSWASRRRLIGPWIVAQGLVLVLWLPWLPIFWRQATVPPVPPWRAPWNSPIDILHAISESISALISGQSAPGATSWLWLVVGVGLLSTIAYRYWNDRNCRLPYQVTLLYLLLPTGTIFGLTLLVSPLYHIRYLTLFGLPLLLIVADLICWLVCAIARRVKWTGWLAAILLLAVNGVSLQRFWYDADFQSDDHRSAVAFLADRWRPGDLILVNAGWAYTAIETYWPQELSGANDAVPPLLTQTARLNNDPMPLPHQAESGVAPLIVRSGSIDGASTLGWGDPKSDFFAVNQQETTAALTELTKHYRRVWHYRLYDTVNDPDAVIRQWLDGHGTQLLDQQIAGRDFLRLQLYTFEQDNPSIATTSITTAITTAITSTLTAPLELVDVQLILPEVAAGSTAYIQTQWQRSAAASLPESVSFSSRLYTDAGLLLAQHDERPLQAAQSWSTAAITTYILALPIPVSTQPGIYPLQLLLYDGTTGAALDLAGSAASTATIDLGELIVTEPTATIVTTTLGPALADFDYIALIQSGLQPTTQVTDGHIALDLIWLPEDNSYRDTYIIQWQLYGEDSSMVAQWEDAMGSWHYPSGAWPFGRPVRQRINLEISSTVADGTYQLVMHVCATAMAKLFHRKCQGAH